MAETGFPLLASLNTATECCLVHRPVPKRCEKAVHGALLRLDLKKFGCIPDGGGCRFQSCHPAQDAFAPAVPRSCSA